MKIYIILAITLCVVAEDVKKAKEDDTAVNKDKRQTQGESVPTHIVYRTARKQQGAPVEEQQDDEKVLSRADAEQYRPGQVFSLNAQELLELQPERKSPLSSNQLLQQLYSNPQPEHKQNLQQIYYLEPQQTGRQVSLQPSHAVIARPDYSSNGGEASVGAALSVSDTSNNAYGQDLLALLGHSSVRQEEPRQQVYISQPQTQPQVQQTPTVQSVAPQYQQVDPSRYVTKPSKKSKLRNKSQTTPLPPTATPEQYLIETTNVQQQQQQQQQQSLIYRPAPQPQRAPQALRYVQIPQYTQQQQQAFAQQALYEQSEPQGLKVVPAPKLTQPPAQFNYRLIPQYQPEASPKQFRVIEAPRQTVRQEQRLSASNVERPVTYLKRFPENEKMRSVKIYDPIAPEGVPQQPAQIVGQQYYLRPAYRPQEQRARYDLGAPVKAEAAPTKAPQSSIFVSKNFPRKLARPQPVVAYRDQTAKSDQTLQGVEQINIEQHGRSLEEQRAQLPPPKNNKAYTPEEFSALVAAGYAVTPVPVSAFNLQEAQSRSFVEAVTPQPKRRALSNRRHQYLPLRADDAP